MKREQRRNAFVAPEQMHLLSTACVPQEDFVIARRGRKLVRIARPPDDMKDNVGMGKGSFEAAGCAIVNFDVATQFSNQGDPVAVGGHGDCRGSRGSS